MFELRPYRKNNQNLSGYNPFREMEDFEKHFFDDPFDYFGTSALAEFKTDIKDEGDSYLIEADLPGFSKGDIHLDIDGNLLTIKAERHSEHEEKDKKHKYIRCERSYGSYCRQFDVSGVDTDDIKAKYEDGVLKLTLPKKPEIAEKGKHLEIE